MTTLTRQSGRNKRRTRIRSKIFGTAKIPRLSVHKSLKHLRVQLIDDVAGHTLVNLSTVVLKSRGNVKSAQALGQAVALKAKEAGIAQVVFDRGGYPYQGQIKSIAEAVRAEGLIF